MQLNQIPTKFQIPFAADASTSFIRNIPKASQIGIQGGAASLNDGFPPLCFIPIGSGGIPPFGQDFNGILNQITLWNQWQQLGGAIQYDSTFQAAVGGYPQGALVMSAITIGLLWLCIVDNNITNPDQGGAGWVRWGKSVLSTSFTYFVDAAAGNDTTGIGSLSAPWQSLQRAWNWVQGNLDLAGQFTVTINCTGNFTTGLNAAGTVTGCASASNVVFNFTSGSSVAVVNNSGITINNGAQLTLGSTGTPLLITCSGSGIGLGIGITVVGASNLTLGNGINFGACFGGHMACGEGSTILAANSYTISGGAPEHVLMFQGGGFFSFSQSTSQVISLVGTPNFSVAFIFVQSPGFVIINSASFPNAVTFSGAATGQRYRISLNGIVFTNTNANPTYLPGNIAGATTFGGQYD